VKSINAAVLSLVAFSSLFFTGEMAFSKPSSSIDLSLALGHRIDHLDWNISGDINGNNPNILSELTWDDLNIYQVKGGGVFSIDFAAPFSLYLRGDLGYGIIYKGDNQDSDYAGNNRTLEFSRSNNDADEGDVIDASFGLGVQFRKRIKKSGSSIVVAPLIGYSYHAQNLKMTQGFQTFPLLGPFPGLNSSYETEWDGPWLGMDFSYLRHNKKNTFNGQFNARIEYHLADYHAEADWNLRTGFAHPKSFVHDADGSGLVASLGWTFPFHPKWSFSIDFRYQNWSTDAGLDTTFFSQEGIQQVFTETGILLEDGIVRTRLNEVNWDSSTVTLGLQYRF